MGSRLPSEDQLSRQFDVSIETVRHALSVLAGEGYIERRQGVGTTIRRGFGEQLVAVYSELNPFLPETSRWHVYLMGMVGLELQQRGMAYRCFCGRTTSADIRTCDEVRMPTCTEFLEEVERDRVAGVITIAADPHPLWYDTLKQRNTPVVGGSFQLPVRVGFDRVMELSRSVEHLVGLGRRRIGLICWSDPHAYIDPFREAMKEFGLSINPDWIRRDLYPGRANTGWEGFREIWTASSHKPDGLIVADDCLLPDIEKVVRELKIAVPQRLAIVGFTNRWVRQPCSLPMACVERDPCAVAHNLVETLLAMRAGDRRPRFVCTPSRWLDLTEEGMAARDTDELAESLRQDR